MYATNLLSFASDFLSLDSMELIFCCFLFLRIYYSVCWHHRAPKWHPKMAIGKNSSKDGLLRRLLERGHMASKYIYESMTVMLMQKKGKKNIQRERASERD